MTAEGFLRRVVGRVGAMTASGFLRRPLGALMLFAAAGAGPSAPFLVAQDAAPASVERADPPDPDSVLEAAFGKLAHDPEQARAGFIAAAILLPPERATAAVQMASLLSRLPPDAVLVLATAELAAREGEGATAPRVLAESASGFSDPTRAMLLAHASRMADRADEPELALAIREELVGELAGRPEADEAALELARQLAGQPGGTARAIRVLEELITRRPNSAVAPSARVELERLRGGG